MNDTDDRTAASLPAAEVGSEGQVRGSVSVDAGDDLESGIVKYPDGK